LFIQHFKQNLKKDKVIRFYILFSFFSTKVNDLKIRSYHRITYYQKNIEELRNFQPYFYRKTLVEKHAHLFINLITLF